MSEKPTIKNIVVTNIPLLVGILHNKKNGKNQSWNSENNIQKLQLNDRNTETDKEQKSGSHHEM